VEGYFFKARPVPVLKPGIISAGENNMAEDSNNYVQQKDYSRDLEL
jgi:hypothetical protein